MPTNLRRVCMLGAFAADYPRHQIIIAGLERVGVEVKCILLPRNLNTAALMLQMIRHWHETADCDVVIIPAFNQLLGPSAWLLRQRSRKPVLIYYRVGNGPAGHFELIGRGPTNKESVACAEALKMENVSFVDMVPPPELPRRVAQAAICLGVFGPRAKTDYVIPNKVFQCMALGRPV